MTDDEKKATMITLIEDSEKLLEKYNSTGLPLRLTLSTLLGYYVLAIMECAPDKEEARVIIQTVTEEVWKRFKDRSIHEEENA